MERRSIIDTIRTSDNWCEINAVISEVGDDFLNSDNKYSAEVSADASRAKRAIKNLSDAVKRGERASELRAIAGSALTIYWVASRLYLEATQ